MNSSLELALALHKENKLDEAKIIYRNIISRDPHNFDSLNLLGLLEHQRGFSGQAIILLEKALAVGTKEQCSDNVVLNNYIIILKSLNRYSETLPHYKDMLVREPDNLDLLVGYTETLLLLDKYDEVLDVCNTLHHRNDVMLVNQGLALIGLHQYQDALDSFEEAKKLNSASALAHWNEALCRLMMGDYENGWEKYKWRWDATKNIKRTFDKPEWTKQESLLGKTIFIHVEQGLGDTIQFVRYVDKVVQLGGQVILGVQRSLKALCSSSIKNCQIISHNDQLPGFDYYCSLMDLPYIFKTTLETIPNKIPYLFSNPSKLQWWYTKISPSQKPKVGIAWRGSSKNSEKRAVSLEMLLSLELEMRGISLKKEITEEEIKLLNNYGVLHFENELNDFSDTAAIIDQLDLVITTDTSVAHLAGALGKSVWIILGYNADWRWLCDCSDSPWYPTAKLFRQTTIGDWNGVLTQIKAEFVRFLKK